jgi:hypothetical protein
MSIPMTIVIGVIGRGGVPVAPVRLRGHLRPGTLAVLGRLLTLVPQRDPRAGADLRIRCALSLK